MQEGSGGYSDDIGDGAELKFLDTTVSRVSVASTGTLDELSSVSEGTAEDERVGRRIYASSVDFIGNVQLPEIDENASVRPGEALRCMVLLDMQANGFATAVSEVLPGTSINTHIRRADQLRFPILYEHFFSLNYKSLAIPGTGGVTSAAPGVVKQFHWHVPIDQSIFYEAGNTRPVTGNLLLLLISKNGICDFNAQARFNYTDN